MSTHLQVLEKRIKMLEQRQRLVNGLDKFVISSENGKVEIHIRDPQTVKQLKALVITNLQRQINDINGG